MHCRSAVRRTVRLCVRRVRFWARVWTKRHVLGTLPCHPSANDGYPRTAANTDANDTCTLSETHARANLSSNHEPHCSPFSTADICTHLTLFDGLHELRHDHSCLA